MKDKCPHHNDDSCRPLGYYIGRAFMRMRTALTRRFAEAGHDLTAQQWSILVYIYKAEGAIQQDIGKMFEKDQAAVARILNRLEKQGLIERVSCPKDKRRNKIYVTEKGKALKEELGLLARENLKQASKGLSSEEISDLKRMLQIIIDNLED